MEGDTSGVLLQEKKIWNSVWKKRYEIRVIQQMIIRTEHCFRDKQVVCSRATFMHSREECELSVVTHHTSK